MINKTDSFICCDWLEEQSIDSGLLRVIVGYVGDGVVGVNQFGVDVDDGDGFGAGDWYGGNGDGFGMGDCRNGGYGDGGYGNWGGGGHGYDGDGSDYDLGCGDGYGDYYGDGYGIGIDFDRYD